MDMVKNVILVFVRSTALSSLFTITAHAQDTSSDYPFSVGYAHSCIGTRKGKLKCFGYNNFGPRSLKNEWVM